MDKESIEMLRSLLVQYMLDSAVSKRHISRETGLNYVTVLSFLSCKKNPSFVTVAKVINFLKGKGYAQVKGRVIPDDCEIDPMA